MRCPECKSPGGLTPTISPSTGVLCGLTGFVLLQEFTGSVNKVCLSAGLHSEFCFSGHAEGIVQPVVAGGHFAFLEGKLTRDQDRGKQAKPRGEQR